MIYLQYKGKCTYNFESSKSRQEKNLHKKFRQVYFVGIGGLLDVLPLEGFRDRQVRVMALFWVERPQKWIGQHLVGDG